MSHTLTEVDAHTTPITVPDGTDSRSNAANVVEAIAQALANRTHRLDLHTAKFDAVNVWEQAQEYDIDQADAPAIRTTKDAGDHAGVPANIWKLQFEFLLTNGTKARLYSGNGTNGNWALTTNAVWDPGGVQTWHKDDDSHESNVLRVFDGEVHFYGKAVGAGSWGPAGWDTTRGVARVGDEVHALGIVAGTKLFRYETPRATWVQLFPEGGLNNFQDRMRLAAAETAVYRLRLPAGAVIGQVNIKVEEYTGVNYDIELFQTHVKAFSDTSTPGSVSTKHAFVHVNPGGTALVRNHILNYPSVTIDNEYDLFWVAVRCNSGSPANLDVYGVQIGFADPGPRNH